MENVFKKTRSAMSGENQEEKIVSIDKEAIRTGEDKKNHWSVPFKLSLNPDRSWQEKFYDVQQKIPLSQKENHSLSKM